MRQVRIVRNVFGKSLPGERKLPGFEASKCEYTFGRVKFPNVTKTKRLLSAVRYSPSWSFFTHGYSNPE